MSKPEARFVSGADLFERWRDDLLSGKRPVRYPVGDGPFANVDVAPGRVVLVGGPPSGGKTMLTMQWVCDALRRCADLRALTCNVEMPGPVLLDRQLSRLSGIPLDVIRDRRLDSHHAAWLERGMEALRTFVDRVAFLNPPFDLGNVAAAADATSADLLLLDYIQRIRLPEGDGPARASDRRGDIDRTMDYLRRFADAGVAVIAVSAVSRGKDSKGRTSYSGDALSLGSFRESSELEFGCDSAYIVAPDPENDTRALLRHLKDRHGATGDIELHVDKARQRITPLSTDPRKTNEETMAELVRDWTATPPAGYAEDDDEEPF